MASMEDFKFFNMMKTSYKKVAGTNDRQTESENAKRKKKKNNLFSISSEYYID